MRTPWLLTVVLVCALGCFAPPPPPGELAAVSSTDYDLLWSATRDVVEEHFELFVQRKEDGYMVSTYKRGEPLPGGYRKDAQTSYDTAEELLHVVRRRLTARILEDEKGIYVVHLEIIRERQGYVPPPPEYSRSYSLYDRDKSALSDTADQGDTVTWHRLGRDLHLEKALLERIRLRVGHTRS